MTRYMEPNLKKRFHNISLKRRRTPEGWTDQKTGASSPGDHELRLDENGAWGARRNKPLGELPHLSTTDRAAAGVAEFVREFDTSSNRLFALWSMAARRFGEKVILQKVGYAGRSCVHQRCLRNHTDASKSEGESHFAAFSALFDPKSLILLLALTIVLCGGCASAKHRHSEADTRTNRFEFTEPQMGVPFRIVLYTDTAQRARAAADAAFSRVKDLNDCFSDYDTDSELNRLSASSGKGRTMTVSVDLWRILVLSQDIARLTDGAFDITVGPYVGLWRVARRQKKLPDPARLAAASESVGYEKLKLFPSDRTVLLTAPLMRLDLGGIAKGYAVDEAFRVLESRGIRRMLIAASGDVRVGEPPPGKAGWNIELADPSPTASPRQLLLRNLAVSTAGDLSQHLDLDGVRYSHIVDPKAGVGLTNQMLVTVIADDCTTSDTLDTTVCVMGPKLGRKLLKNRAVGARIVTKTARGDVSILVGSFKKYLQPGDSAAKELR